MLKANAYGLGLAEVASVFERFSEKEVPYFCLARMQEVIQARECGIKRKIILLSDFPRNLSELPPRTEILATGIHDLRTIAGTKSRVKFHLKLNTGMNRLGLRLPESKMGSLLEQIKSRGHQLQGICSQLASADGPSERTSLQQLAKFEEWCFQLQKWWGGPIAHINLGNSRSVLRGIGMQSPGMTGFRPGLHLWGIRDPDNFMGISPVVTLRVPVRQLYWIGKGEQVGYGNSFKSKSKMKIAILNIGYADGIRRGSWRTGMKFWFRGQALSAIGNESMDMCAVDCTHSPKLKVGDELNFVGPEQSLEAVATAWKTIPYEVLTALAPRILRVLVK